MRASAHEGKARGLSGEVVLVVEDEFLIGLQLQITLEDAGAEVCGPFATVGEALDLIARQDLSAALLDIRIGKETIGPVAEELARRRVPFAFYTGQLLTDPIRARWPDSPIICKPAQAETIVYTLAGLIDAYDADAARVSAQSSTSH
jgi:DNA-binding response OmpR family regulator